MTDDKRQSTIIELSCKLAVCELVETFNKLPEEFMNEDDYKEEYEGVFNLYYDKYNHILTKLIER